MNNLSHESNTEPVSAEELAELGRELRTLWHAIVRGVTQPLQRQQFWVLTALAERPRRMSDLAECAETSQASLTGIVDRLEENGLVRRHRSEDDRRVVEVEVTEGGRELLGQTNAAFLSRLEELLTPLSPDERSELLVLMRKLTERGR